MTKKICVWLVLLSIIVTCALAQQPNSLSTSQPDLSAVTIQAPFGYWYPSSFFTETPGVQLSTSYQGIMVIATNSPIKIGHFDKNGKVVNGDYVMVFYADLDTAPISKLVVQQLRMAQYRAAGGFWYSFQSGRAAIR